MLCLCLDPCAQVLFAVFMLRSTCLCAPCHAYVQIYIFVYSVPCSCVQIYILVAMSCASIAFLSLCPPFLVFFPFRQGVDLDLVVQAYIHIPRPISKGLDHFLYACLYLLASILYLHVCLTRSRLGYAQILCLCLDPYAQVLFVVQLVYAFLAMLMFRSISLFTSWLVHVCRSTYWLLCHVLLQPFCLFVPFFLCFFPLGRVQIQILWSRPTSIYLGLYQKAWIIFFMHVYICLLLFISMFV